MKLSYIVFGLPAAILALGGLHAADDAWVIVSDQTKGMLGKPSSSHKASKPAAKSTKSAAKSSKSASKSSKPAATPAPKAPEPPKETPPPAPKEPAGPTMEELQAKADAGDASAWLQLGVRHLKGDGTPRDDSRAWTCFCKSADQGNTKGKLYKGLCLLKGRGVAVSEDEGLDLVLDCALAGDTEAMIIVAGFYREGEYLKKDADTAKRWLQKAADLGDGNAKTLLERNPQQSGGSSSRRQSSPRQSPPPTPQAPSAPAASVDNGMQIAANHARHHIQVLDSDTANQLSCELACYAPQVDYFGVGIVGIDFIRRDTLGSANKYPSRHYSPVRDVQVECSGNFQGRESYHVAQTFDCNYYGGAGSLHLVLRNHYTISMIGGSPRITRIRSVINPQNDSGGKEARFLIDNWGDYVQWNPAFDNGGSASLSSFLRNGQISTTARDSRGRTALHHACARGRLMLCKWLLQRGADPNAVDNNGKKPADYVPDLNRKAILDLLPVRYSDFD